MNREIELRNCYYWVSWRIRIKELCVTFLLLFSYWFGSGIVLKKYMGQNFIMVKPIYYFTSITVMFLVYLGIKVPCCRWKKGQIVQGEYRDITKQQDKYRKVILRMSYIILMVVFAWSIYAAVFLRMEE